MIGFLIGLVVGGIFGIIVMAMMHIASEADDKMEEINSEGAKGMSRSVDSLS